MGHLPTPTAHWALFLDFDGTLVELSPHPDSVRPAPGLPALLTRLNRALGGAVAVISGRTLASLTHLLGEPALPMAGVHGLEWRDADGRVTRAGVDPEALATAREALEHFVAAHPGTHIEDKGLALALHYRHAPECRAEAEALMANLRQRLGSGYHVQTGKCVRELKPEGWNKGTVVSGFLDRPPFRARTPVVLGDDVTDEDAFRLAVDRGGHALLVGGGRDTAATGQLATVQEVLEWLAFVAQTLEQSPTNR